ncbi:hypothetical protein VTO73DRAFT_14312 [Trametes versicolor]
MDIAPAHSGCTPRSCHDIGQVAYAGHLAQCAHCKKRERQLPADTKLKRCAGCSIIMYCSRECQKAAWPHHRYSCRRPQDSRDDGENLAGYDSPISLAQAVTDWADGTHGTAFSTLAGAMVRKRGGIAANSTSRILLFEFTPRAEKRGSGNPAEAFLLTKADIVHKDVAHGMISSWDDITAECQRKKEWFRRKMPPNRTVLNVIPAVAMVAGTNTVSTHYYPILALQCGTTAALPKGIRTLCMDVIEMCYITVNAGLVLRRYECTGCRNCYREPVMGKMVKHRKKWEWEEMAGFNWLMMARPFSGVPPAKRKQQVQTYARKILSGGGIGATCGHCWKYESDLPANTKLKRCAGCSVAVYCSRDCQKAAWATHKRLCRPSDSESAPNSLPNQLAGHSTPLELFTNLNEWVSNTHDYAFRTLMRAAVLLNGGGLAANFAEPCIVVFKLTRVAEPKTPAHAFQLKVQVPQTLKGEGLRATVKEGQAAVHAACQLQFEAIRRANAAVPEYAGALLAMVWVEGTEIRAHEPGVRGRRGHVRWDDERGACLASAARKWAA